MSKVKNSVIMLFLSLIVSACAANKAVTDCPAGVGVQCKSISEVNNMVNLKELGGDKVIESKLGYEEKPMLILNTAFTDRNQPKEVKRIPEKTMRIWMNSFTDDKGDFVKETYTYTVIEPGFWDE
ncbi:conjugal transfer pilus assembly protein TraV [Alphaproteobacteria bacterium]